MSTNRGIFESFPSQSADRIDSPFEVVVEPVTPAAAAGRVESPFTVVDKASIPWPVEPGRPARVPARRNPESPFQLAEPAEVFGLNAAVPSEVRPAVTPVASIPISASPPQAVASPFSVEPQRGLSPPTAAYGHWQESPASGPVTAPLPQAYAQATPSAFAATAPALVTQAAVAADESTSDSFSIRQLELRAIFGVARELTADEILQRSRMLPGMRNVVRVSPPDMATVEALKQLLPNLGLGSGGVKLYSDSGPLEFIREGAVMLAVQTDGGFTPGVRETLMLVARELDRL